MKVLSLTTLDGQKRSINMDRACYWGDVHKEVINDVKTPFNKTKIWFDANNWIEVLEKTVYINGKIARGQYEMGDVNGS